MSFFYKAPSYLGEHQNTPCSGFEKDPRFLNMVMTFVLHPLSHYNLITEPRAQFLLSLLEGLTIDFSSHFILFLIDVYKDTATRDKLIFPSTITRILHHVSISSLLCYVCHQHGDCQTETRPSFDQNSHGLRQQLLQLLLLHLPPPFFFFCGWFDPQSGHGAVSTNGCSP